MYFWGQVCPTAVQVNSLGRRVRKGIGRAATFSQTLGPLLAIPENFGRK